MGQKNGQKVLKNAKKSQNMFHLISTVIEWSWTINSEVDVAKSATRFGKKLPKSATRFGKNSPKSATKLVQKVPKIGGPIKKCYCKDLSQIVQG